ncbi:MAG: PilZ domain-containing protein [Candidatus Omnitrophica bacterium]|nr:PilZ domain-containing protein [Candidatus Omnitrophota bacterium]
MSTPERRRSPRVDSNIPLKISGEEFDIITEGKNLSSSGAYCTADRYLEPMTKLKIQFILPFKKKDQTATKKISCSGVVVRTQANPEGKNFDMAIYFNEIEEKNKKIIAEYVTSLLKNNPAA